MEYFALNKEFNNFDEVLKCKKCYEVEKNVVLVIRDSHKLKGESKIVNQFVYDRLSLQCKAGKERPTQSKGIRMAATFKKNCPVKINMIYKDNKLKVSSLNLSHDNHQLNEQTYNHYPENVRLSTEEIQKATTMLQADGKKFKIKATLMKDRIEKGNRAPVILQAIHNLNTKDRLKKEQIKDGENELEKLLNSMLQVPGARVEILRDEHNELVCIYFQDSRMIAMFNHYPELLLFDATYKLNNREMPLFIQSVVDGNGMTEIVSLTICKSESRVMVEFVLECFKKYNTNWQKVKCVIGDKDFADRVVYQEQFVGIVLQICLFHVLRTFNREVTTVKRNITTDQREKSLNILQLLCYSRSESEYQKHYEKLSELKLEKVMEYFDTNWHCIRNEWSLYARNSYCNYLNDTNNRSESMNQKLKMISNRHAGLLKFFENVSTSLAVLTSEKDIKAVRLHMRTPRIQFEDDALTRYHEFLSPFIFLKIHGEFEMIEKVNFISIDESSATSDHGRTVSGSKCTCGFHLRMNLPCKHILKFRKVNEINVFAPELCATRWTKHYYNASHPALQMNQNIPPARPMYIQKIRAPEEKDKYKCAATLTKDINSLVSTMVTGEYTYFLEKLKDLRNEIIGTPSGTANLDENGDSLQEVASAGMIMSIPNRSIDVLDLSLPKAHSTAVGSALHFSEVIANSNITGHEISLNSLNKDSSKTDLINEASKRSENDSLDINVSPSQFSVVASASTLAIRQINLPSKRLSIGRPKGSTNTVIGTKLKGRQKPTNKITESSATLSTQLVQPLRIRKRKSDGNYEVSKKVTNLRT